MNIEADNIISNIVSEVLDNKEVVKAFYVKDKGYISVEETNTVYEIDTKCAVNRRT